MGFKTGKSFLDVNKGIDKFSANTNKKIGRAIYSAATTGAGISKTITPNDSANLINSQFIDVKKMVSGWSAKIGYTANYAAAVHEKTGVLLGNQNHWQPNAEPQFLSKAFDGANGDAVSKVFFKELKS